MNVSFLASEHNPPECHFANLLINYLLHINWVMSNVINGYIPLLQIYKIFNC